MIAKKMLVVRSNEEAKNVMFGLEKDTSKVENTLLQWILQNIFKNQTFQRIAKFIMADFYEMNFMKGIVILVNADKMYNIQPSASHCLLVEMRWKFMIKVVLLEICLYVYYVLPLIRGRLHLVRDTAAEKEVHIAIQMTMKYVHLEIQENRNGRKQ